MANDKLVITEEDIKELGLEKSSETKITIFIKNLVFDTQVILPSRLKMSF